MPYTFFLFEDGKQVEAQPVFNEISDIVTKIGPVYCRLSKQKYIENVHKLLVHIKRGDIYEINYCIEFFCEDAIINPQQVFKKLNELTEAPFAQLLKAGDDYIICASPERFIQSVVVDELFGVYTFKNVHQMLSTVSCKLKENTNLNDIIKATFPPASMTGAPKLKAIELIKKYELSPRGIYSGAMGFINENGEFDFCVVIRTVLYNEKLKRLSFHVGSAITAQCNPEEEWNECLLKAETLFKALGVSVDDVIFTA
jgi:para-aminobenzoate synthetase component 1